MDLTTDWTQLRKELIKLKNKSLENIHIETNKEE